MHGVWHRYRSQKHTQTHRIKVKCGDRGRNWSSVPSRHGVKPVGFAAVAVPQPAGGAKWKRAEFEFGCAVGVEEEGEEDEEDSDGE